MLLRIVNRCTEVAVILLLSIITVIVPLEVVLRYGFGKSLMITEEISRYLMVWVVFLASSLAMRRGAHIQIDIFKNLFEGRSRALFELVSYFLELLFLVFLIVEGSLILPYQVHQYIATLPSISIMWFYLAIPVGFFLMLLNLLPGIWDALKRIRPGNDSAGSTRFIP